MNPAQLLAHFDRISDAPNAIPRLRRFILELAVRGKLVEQDPKDEPASSLLKRIQAEGHQLEDAIDPLAEDDQSFKIPQSWAWIRIGNAAHVEMGQSPPSENYNQSGNGIPFYQGKTDFGMRCPTPRYWCNLPSKLAQKNDILISVRAPVGPTNVASEGCCIGRGLAALRPRHGVYLEFLLYSLKGFESAIAAMGYGTTFVAITKKQLVSFALPLPPLTEQHRIVAKVDELMALCDRLEAAQTERENRRDRLAAASLHRLNNGADADAFRNHARFTLDNLPRLTTRPEQIQQLRQTILNLAVRGQLVPQDPKDKPAPVFAIETRAEEENRIQLQLPLGWSWARVEDVAEARLGKMLDKAKNSGKAYRYLRNTNIHWFDVRMDELKDLRIEANEVEKYVLRNGDVLICEGGHGIGRTAVWRGMETNIIFQKALHRVRPGQALNSEFFAYCVCVYFHAGVLQSYFTGVGIPHFTGVALSKLVFPLPPIKEQHRIVAKVEELMALCDRLEAQLTTTQTESRRLLEAALHHALSA